MAGSAEKANGWNRGASILQVATSIIGVATFLVVPIVVDHFDLKALRKDLETHIEQPYHAKTADELRAIDVRLGRIETLMSEMKDRMAREEQR